MLKSSFTISDYSVIIGGDFNVIFDQELDGSGGLKKTKDSVKVLEDICLEHDLLDIWRVRHLKEKRFTWRQKTPIIQRRLDFWLISDVLQDDVVSVDIKSSIKSDHSAITLLINGVDDSERGPSFWKFNSTLVNDSDYRFLLVENIKNWLEEFKEVVDKRGLWDLLKYKIRQLTIKYNKEKAHSEGKIECNECFKVLQSFQKNKTPGNDRLTIEFYVAFWPLIGKHLVDCVNYSFEFGELSNSQKQAIITLEKTDSAHS